MAYHALRIRPPRDHRRPACGSIPSASMRIATPERPPRTGANGFPDELLGDGSSPVQDRFKVRVYNEQRERRFTHWCWRGRMERPVLPCTPFRTQCRGHESDDGEDAMERTSTLFFPRRPRQADWDRRDADDVRTRARASLAGTWSIEPASTEASTFSPIMTLRRRPRRCLVHRQDRPPRMTPHRQSLLPFRNSSA